MHNDNGDVVVCTMLFGRGNQATTCISRRSLGENSGDLIAAHLTVQAIAAEIRGPVIAGLCRTIPGDIEATIKLLAEFLRVAHELF